MCVQQNNIKQLELENHALNELFGEDKQKTHTIRTHIRSGEVTRWSCAETFLHHRLVSARRSYPVPIHDAIQNQNTPTRSSSIVIQFSTHSTFH